MTLPVLENLRPVDRVSVVDGVTAQLLDLILDGDAPAGTVLTEDQVTTYLRVSRVTARSAIAELTASGILDKEANRPASVRRLTEDDIRGLYRARTPIELEAVRFITHRGGELLPAVLESIDELAASEDAPGHQKIKHNLDFHRQLVVGTGNPWLLRAYTGIEGGLQLALAQSEVHPTCQATADEHLRLVKQFTKDNWDAAREAMIDHLKESKDGVVNSVI